MAQSKMQIAPLGNELSTLPGLVQMCYISLCRKVMSDLNIDAQSPNDFADLLNGGFRSMGKLLDVVPFETYQEKTQQQFISLFTCNLNNFKSRLCKNTVENPLFFNSSESPIFHGIFLFLSLVSVKHNYGKLISEFVKVHDRLSNEVVVDTLIDLLPLIFPIDKSVVKVAQLSAERVLAFALLQSADPEKIEAFCTEYLEAEKLTSIKSPEPISKPHHRCCV